MRAIAYTRVSTGSDEQLSSLRNQIDYYTKLFETRKIEHANCGIYYKKDGTYTVLDNGIFADEGITGTKMKNRKAFQEMLKLAESGMFDTIFVKNVQRFARNTGEGSTTLKRLKSWGVRVIFEEGNLDSSKPSQEMVIDMLLSVAQAESQSKSIAVKFGIRSAQKKGKWTSNRPYGYNREKGYLQINQKEAENVKIVYDLYVSERYGFQKVAKALDHMGIPNPSGKEWYYQRIKLIILNPLYKGVQRTHMHENMDVNITSIKNVPEDEWLITKNEELRIIDDDTWQQAQDIYTMKRKRYDHYSYRNPHIRRIKDIDTNTFSAIVFCDNCGGLMRRRRKRTRRNGKMITLKEWEWLCTNNDVKGTEYCAFRNAIDEKVLFQYAKEMITGYRDNKELLDSSFKMFLDTYFNSTNVVETLEKIIRELEELKQERTNRLKLYDKGILDETELEEYTNKDYRPKMKELLEEKTKYQNIENEVARIKRRYIVFLKGLNNIDLDNLTNADIKKVFSGIYVGTYKNFDLPNAIFTLDDNEYDFRNPNLENLPYTKVNHGKKEGTFKHISCEFNFLGKNEMDLFQQMAEKDYTAKSKNSLTEVVKSDDKAIDMNYVSHRLVIEADKLKG